MQQRRLGRTEIYVSELGLGGLFTSSLGPGYDESLAAVRKALELGINLIDTAPAYADSEEVLGRILHELLGSNTAAFKGTPLILSTKLGGRPQPFRPRDVTGSHSRSGSTGKYHSCRRHPRHRQQP